MEHERDADALTMETHALQGTTLCGSRGQLAAAPGASRARERGCMVWISGAPLNGKPVISFLFQIYALQSSRGVGMVHS